MELMHRTTAPKVTAPAVTTTSDRDRGAVGWVQSGAVTAPAVQSRKRIKMKRVYNREAVANYLHSHAELATASKREVVAALKAAGLVAPATHHFDIRLPQVSCTAAGYSAQEIADLKITSEKDNNV